LLRQVDPMMPVKQVHATRGKGARAEPVSALYEQGKVFHGPGLADLEAQMCLMTPRGYEGAGSPDRADALVWALSELMLEKPPGRGRPGVRSL
jgi:phage terminase large subunit-like protein